MNYYSYYVAHDYLAHHGVLGMKWGQHIFGKDSKRSNKSARSKTHESTSNRIVLKGTTKNGEKITAVQQEDSGVAKFLAKHNSKVRDNIMKTKVLSLRNGKGDRIGELTLKNESPTSVNVVWLEVDENHRGKNYGSAAMKLAEKYARQQGAKQMTLEVPGESPDARHIYERQGFVKVKDLEDSDAWGGLTSMKKRLK